MKKLCELRKRPTLLAAIGVPFLAAIIWLLFVVALNAFVSIEWLNGWLVIAAAVLFLSAPILLWSTEIYISVEPEKNQFRINRQILIFGKPIAKRSMNAIDDVYWQEDRTGESGGIHYHIYGRSQPERGNIESVRDVSILGGLGLLVSLDRNDVDEFRKDFCNLRSAV